MFRRFNPGPGYNRAVREPIEAYEQIAPVFRQISEQRREYLAAIEARIIAEIPAGSRSMLDVGAGDGSRGLRIAAAAGLTHAVLLEPAAAMRNFWPPDARGGPIRAEQLGEKTERFDVILCLWNVLGHIFPESARVDVLRHCARLLNDGGSLFVDVSNRHNARHYGIFATLGRLGGGGADVAVRWGDCETKGHVFTDREFRGLCERAGLRVRNRFVVDYRDGRLRKSVFSGHLLYVLSK